MPYIIIIIQYLFSVLFTNKHALKVMRYLNRYDRMTIYIYIYKYADKIQQLGIYNEVNAFPTGN